MKSRTIAIVDLETVRDSSLLEGRIDSQCWPPPIGWKIVAIGILIVDVGGTASNPAFKVRALRCGTGDERDIITKFWSFFDQKAPQIVTWNGRRFDMPVLIQRAFHHGIRIPKWFQVGDRFSNYRYRYCSDWHCDLMDLMSEYGASTNVGMDLMASSAGLPGKVGGHGSGVQEMYDAGALEKIAAYCECDVLNLYGLYLRWAYVTGGIQGSAYDCALEDLSQFLLVQSAEKQHCSEFLQAWNSAKLLNPAQRTAGIAPSNLSADLTMSV